MRFSIHSECSQVRKSLWDYAGGGLNDSERKSIAVHITTCDKCAEELAGYSAARNLITNYRSVSPPESRLGWRDLERKLTAQPARTSMGSLLGLRFSLGAGVLAATAAVLFFTAQNSKLPNHQGLINQGQAQVAVPDTLKMDGAPNGAESAEHSMALAKETNRGPSAPGIKHNAPSYLIATSRRSKAPHAILAHNVKLTPSASEEDQDGTRVAMNDYVLASASNGSDEDQSRRYVIDLVASASATEVAEEAHPW